MNTREEFEALLDVDPADWLARVVYADWLEEHGMDELAAAQRWMARHRRHPVNSPGGVSFGRTTKRINFRWVWEMRYGPSPHVATPEEDAGYVPGKASEIPWKVLWAMQDVIGFKGLTPD